MNRYIDEAQFIKVDYALEKICKAYASERISQSLFRHQRAALIDVLQYPELPFPELVLNEFAQAFEDNFMPEETPLVNDYNPPVYPEDREFNPVGYFSVPGEQRPESRLHREQDETGYRSHFDRYYWLYLSLFTFSVILFVFMSE